MLKSFSKETFLYLSSRVFLINLGIAIAFVFLLLSLTFCGLRSYTNNGDSFPTPNLVGYTLEDLESKKIANLENVKYIITDSSAFRWKDNVPGIIVPPNTITSQTPAPSHLIKEDRILRLTVTPSVMPKVYFNIDKTFNASGNEVIRKLKANKIHVIEKLKIVDDTYLLDDKIYSIEQNKKIIISRSKENIDSKFSLTKGSTVVVYTAKHSGANGELSETVPVPPLTNNHTFCSAKKYLEIIQKDFQLTAIPSSLAPDTCGGYQGFIYKQEPLQGTLAPRGSTIKVSISSDGSIPL